ncbi:MAG: MarR family transcriptional regulator [Pseudomonadota bacterium]|nr:MarR family transcriptional regulator [Pseudomonadota bacterium]
MARPRRFTNRRPGTAPGSTERLNSSGRLKASLSTLAVETGLSKSAVQTALRHLRRRGFIETTHAGTTSIPAHRVKAPWRERL